MNTRTLVLVFTLSMVAVGIWRIPMAAVGNWMPLDSAGVSYMRASGTIWGGDVQGLTWRGRALGDTKVALRPLSLLLGQARLRVAFDGKGALSGDGALVLGLAGRLTIENMSAQLALSDLPVILPLNGTINLRIAEATFDTKGCRRVDAEIATDTLSRQPAGLAWSGPLLSGTASCSNGNVMVTLTGDRAPDSVKVAMDIFPTGDFRVAAEARTADQDVVRVLTAAGFTFGDGAMKLEQTGRWG